MDKKQLQQQQQPNLFQAQGTKKRLVMTHELSSRFRAKEDFVKYFKEVGKYKSFCLTIFKTPSIKSASYIFSTILCTKEHDV